MTACNEFTEDHNDASMCLCGIPALTHDCRPFVAIEDDVRNPPLHPATEECSDTCPTWLHGPATCCHFHAARRCDHPNHGSADHNCAPFVSADNDACIECGNHRGWRVEPDWNTGDAAQVQCRACTEHDCPTPPAWCLCGFVDDLGDGTCGNCGLRIMTEDDEPRVFPPGGSDA